MKLIGSYFSPYTRRVAVSLNALGISYEFVPVSVLAEQDRVRALNPVVRIPILVLPDGEALIESYAILDEVDMMHHDRALTPRQGTARRAVMQMTALAIACMEKAQWAFYEGRFRPASMIHGPWVDHNDRQVLSGLRRLDEIVSGVRGGDRWMAGTATISQADITTAVVFGSIRTLRSNLDVNGSFPHLRRFAERCEELEIFSKAPAPPLGPAPALPTA